MFSNSSKSIEENIICKGASLNGSLVTKSPLVINGGVHGNVSAPKVTISGKVTGDVFAMNTIHLKDTAVVEGNIWAGKLEVDYGGIINGACQIKASAGKKKTPSPISR